MPLFTPEGDMSVGLRRTLTAGLAVVALGGAAELIHHYSRDDNETTVCEGVIVCENSTPLDPRTGVESDELSVGGAPEYADDTTPEDETDTAEDETEETTEPQPEATAQEQAATSNGRPIALRKKLGKATCQYWGTSRHQDIEYLDSNNELRPFVRVDSRHDGVCGKPNHGAALYGAASIHAAKVTLGNTPTTHGYKVLDGTLVEITGVECGDEQTSQTPEGETMEAAAWVSVRVPVGNHLESGKLPVKDVGYIDTSALRNHVGMYQKNMPDVAHYYDGC